MGRAIQVVGVTRKGRDGAIQTCCATRIDSAIQLGCASRIGGVTPMGGMTRISGASRNGTNHMGEGTWVGKVIRTVGVTWMGTRIAS